MDTTLRVLLNETDFDLQTRGGLEPDIETAVQELERRERYIELLNDLKSLTRLAKAQLDAISLAGDLTIYGKRDNVFLIREINGEKKYAKLDLTSINVVNSPVYYLTQNDVIYVEPNNSRVRQSSYNPFFIPHAFRRSGIAGYCV